MGRKTTPCFWVVVGHKMAKKMHYSRFSPYGFVSSDFERDLFSCVGFEGFPFGLFSRALPSDPVGTRWYSLLVLAGTCRSSLLIDGTRCSYSLVLAAGTRWYSLVLLAAGARWWSLVVRSHFGSSHFFLCCGVHSRW